MREMVIYGVSFDMVGKQPIVLLEDGGREPVPADLDRASRGGRDSRQAAERGPGSPDDA